MIDENIEQYQKEVMEILGPMGITAKVSVCDSCYFLTVDGSKLYPTKAQWKERIGREFPEFIRVFIPKMYHSMLAVEVSETCVEFEIGTIFDIMLRIKSYDND